MICGGCLAVRFTRVFAMLVCLALVAGSAHAQLETGCRVHDPELSGAYSGGCKDGWADGEGVARGKAQYSGAFRSGRKHGKGSKTWANGDRYVGDFKADRRSGGGQYVWGPGSQWPGERYTGGYVDDLRQGDGVYEWPNGERLAGPWERDRFVGAPSKSLVNRSRMQAELAVAVGVPGTRVCRQMEVGVATREFIRGTVTAARGDRIDIRIDEPGVLGHTMGEVVVHKGTVITDLMTRWLPCI